MGFVTALLMGIAYVLPPGPVTVETVRQSMLGGRRSALAVQLGAVVGDLLCAALMMAGLGHVLRHGNVQFGLGLVGAALLVYLGIAAFRDGWCADQTMNDPHTAVQTPQSLLQSVGTGVGLALANPYALVFWLSMGSTAMTTSVTSLSGFFVGSFCASVLTALVAGQLRGTRARHVARWIWKGCGALLLFLGIQLGYTTLAVL